MTTTDHTKTGLEQKLSYLKLHIPHDSGRRFRAKPATHSD